jgi:hypothetical protein
VIEYQGVEREEVGREPGGILLQALELSALKQEAVVELLVPKVERPESGGGGEKEKAPLRQLPGLIDFPDPNQEVGEDILKPKVEEMEDDPGEYVEIDCDMKLLEEETENLCSLIIRGDMRFEVPRHLQQLPQLRCGGLRWADLEEPDRGIIVRWSLGTSPPALVADFVCRVGVWTTASQRGAMLTITGPLMGGRSSCTPSMGRVLRMPSDGNRGA